jgi:hypothetical protein
LFGTTTGIVTFWVELVKFLTTVWLVALNKLLGGFVALLVLLFAGNILIGLFGLVTLLVV